MLRSRVIGRQEARGWPTVAVPVEVRNGVVALPAGLADEFAGWPVPAELPGGFAERHGLTGVGSALVWPATAGPTAVLVVVDAQAEGAEGYRLAGAAAARASGEGDLVLVVPTGQFEELEQRARALVEGAALASFRADGDRVRALGVLPWGTPLPTVPEHDAITRAVGIADTVAEGVDWARHLIQSPANVLGPRELADAAVERLGQDSHVSVEVWTESRIRAERLGALLAVGAGSAQPTRLVRATYDPAPGEALTHLVVVGKGVTFDSGGLALKPLEAMATQKTDMTGAAVVLGATSVASRLGLRVRITALAPLAENAVGGSSMRPGDVIVARDGSRIEVLNTDAEGRLLLADALSLAAELAPDVIVDVATLTGAQKVALGDEVGALFASDDAVAQMVERASQRSGEPLWRLPLVDAYRGRLHSDVADVANVESGPGRSAGAVVAALFLERFVHGQPWAHLDIAGPARSTSARHYVPRGGTAFGMRTLIELARLAASPRG